MSTIPRELMLMPDMVYVPPGSFMMGLPPWEMIDDQVSNEGPQIEVKIEYEYLMSRFLVSQRKYQRLMRKNPSFYKPPEFLLKLDRPVTQVKWPDANEYCERLTRIYREKSIFYDRFEFRLPTEAEWEYACRAGTNTKYSFGNGENIDECKRYFNISPVPTPVDQFLPNPWGLYDMHGNVWEWCEDRYQSKGCNAEYFETKLLVNPRGPICGDERVVRGVGHSACRFHAYEDDIWGLDIGFRVVLSQIR